MPAQQDASLKLLVSKNRLFGTIRLNPLACSALYDSNLTLEQGQIPSTYFFGPGLFDEVSTRYRPFHEQGFFVEVEEPRMYWLVAGFTGTINSLRSALATDAKPLTKAFFQSRNFIYAPLGVNKTTVAGSIKKMLLNAKGISTTELEAYNQAGQQINAGVYFIIDGALKGTFWASQEGGWSRGGLGQNVKRLFPLDIVDYPVAEDEVPEVSAWNTQFNLAMGMVPDSKAFHWGHAFMTIEAIEAYYKEPAMLAGSGAITGQDLWDRMLRLGAYEQNLGYAVNGAAFGALPMRAGVHYFSKNSSGGIARQKQLVCDLIYNFGNA
ncbi:hypothetical protein E1162_15230 [Rhodobacteraceae bacterium RKSG542]|uniref:hypothetical protein n=1 Tax=Pseudovibrio flavus TaxID=2529854 RepID=UPI0012BC63AC|nr:hypothetical protein [Pseudovibrio flavus]MTI18596.1 hypothetical protein [Pseudovibrio flavus]